VKTPSPSFKLALSHFLRQTFQRFSVVITRSIAVALPENRWYPTAFRLMRVLITVSGPFVTWTPHRASWLIYGWLKQFLRYERRFPIPIRTVGGDVVQEARSNVGGVAVVSVHVPLGPFSIRSLVDIGCPPDAVLAHGDLLKDGMFPVWDKIDALPGLATEGNVLVKSRSILRRGGSIAAMIDTQLGKPINVNILRLLRSTGARVIFVLAELQASGEILVEFYNPPDPYCSTDEGILKNVEFFKKKVDDLLQRSRQPYRYWLDARRINAQLQEQGDLSGSLP
jgi:hypothetical protein